MEKVDIWAELGTMSSWNGKKVVDKRWANEVRSIRWFSNSVSILTTHTSIKDKSKREKVCASTRKREWIDLWKTNLEFIVAPFEFELVSIQFSLKMPLTHTLFVSLSPLMLRRWHEFSHRRWNASLFVRFSVRRHRWIVLLLPLPLPFSSPQRTV